MLDLSQFKKVVKDYPELEGFSLNQVVRELEEKENFESKTISLSVLMDALKNGVVYYNNRGIKTTSQTVSLISLSGNHFVLVALSTALEFKDYQKTWWLKGGK